jgi:hypothetical protein
MLSFVLGKSLSIPFGGLWVALTAVVVTQVSVGGSLKATIEYLTGTLAERFTPVRSWRLFLMLMKFRFWSLSRLPLRRSPCSLQ